MKIYIQWSLATPQDWQPYTLSRAADVRALPRKPFPADNAVIDNTPGWIAALNVQGVVFDGFDHYGVDISADGLQVKVWNDDPRSDYGLGKRWAQTWTLATPKPDVRFGGKVNTDQKVTWYADAGADPVTYAPGIPLRPYAEFVPPDTRNTWHGIALPNAQWSATRDVRSTHVWQEWVI